MPEKHISDASRRVTDGHLLRRVQPRRVTDGHLLRCVQPTRVTDSHLLRHVQPRHVTDVALCRDALWLDASLMTIYKKKKSPPWPFLHYTCFIHFSNQFFTNFNTT
jgi:hypothetical protein